MFGTSWKEALWELTHRVIVFLSPKFVSRASGGVITQGDDVRFVSVRTGALWGDRRIIRAGLRLEDRILSDPPQSAFD